MYMFFIVNYDCDIYVEINNVTFVSEIQEVLGLKALDQWIGVFFDSVHKFACNVFSTQN